MGQHHLQRTPADMTAWCRVHTLEASAWSTCCVQQMQSSGVAACVKKLLQQPFFYRRSCDNASNIKQELPEPPTLTDLQQQQQQQQHQQQQQPLAGRQLLQHCIQRQPVRCAAAGQQQQQYYHQFAHVHQHQTLAGRMHQQWLTAELAAQLTLQRTSLWRTTKPVFLHCLLPWHSQCDGHQLQQRLAYHPATHRARLLTSKLQNQKHWRDLQFMYDTNGGGTRLNAIHLATVLQQLARVAPAPQLTPAAERQQLRDFTAEVITACHAKLHKCDHKTLAKLAQGLASLGLEVASCQASSAGPSSNSSSSSSNTCTAETVEPVSTGGSLLNDLLSAVIKQLPQASSQSWGMLCWALTNLLLQQQQAANNSTHWRENEQQHALLQQLVSCLVARLRTLAATRQLLTSDASKAALAAGRFAAAVKSTSITSSPGAAVNVLAQELQSVVLLAAEQALQSADACTAVLPYSDASHLLMALAKTRAAASSGCVLGLVRQYSEALHHQVLASDIGSNETSSGRQYRQYRVSAAAAATPHCGDEARHEEMVAAIRSLPPTIWAVGRLLELQSYKWQQAIGPQGQQQQAVLHQLQYCMQLWQMLDACITTCTAQVPGFTPVQLAQLANGLAKLVLVSRNQVAAVLAAESSSSCTESANSTSHAPQQPQSDVDDVSGEVHAAANILSSELSGPRLKRLLQQHVSRVEGLLPMMPAAQRLQMSHAYKQLGVQLPRAVALVFERDAAAAAKMIIT